MTPRDGAGAASPDIKALPPVDLGKWLWVDDCVRELLPASILMKQRLLIIGSSGMGKTLLTRQIVVLLCDAQRDAAAGAPLLLPYRIPLIEIGTLCEKAQDNAQDRDLFEEYLEITWVVGSIPVKLYRHAKNP